MGTELKIHTQMGPAPAAQGDMRQSEQAKERRKLFRRKERSGGESARQRLMERWRRSAPGDRLLRNTSIACALLLSIMALRNAELPWTQKAVASIEKVMTMKIDLDESLGRLHFVRELVPETALVFWNARTGNSVREPVEGNIEHAYSEKQPWRVYACADGASVAAAMDGKVKQVEKGAMADYIVLITHDAGLETVYAYMAEVSVQPGDTVYAGDVIGVTASGGGSRLYFAMRLDGEDVDPGEYE